MIKGVIGRIRLWLLPQDPESMSDETRGAERNRRAVLTGSVATVARVVQVGSSLITVPLTLNYLGNERFGLWMTISSVLAMATFADFGIGNGVLNTVAKAFGKDDKEGIRKAVSSGFAVLNMIATLLLVLFFAIYRFVNWADFFRVTSPQARAEAGPALAVFATCFALNISMDVVQRVQLGLQEGYRFSLWQLCGSVVGFIGVLAGIWFHVSLPILVVAIAGAPIFATTLNVIHFFGFVRPDLRPMRKLVASNVISEIAKLGGLFFVLQVVVAVSYSADNFIIARTLGAVNVPEYSIPQRMFAVITMMSGMLVAPLWPAYSEAVSRGHMDWVRRTLGRSLLLVLALTSTASLIMLLAAYRLIHWWVGSRIHPSFLLLLGLTVWTVMGCCGDAVAIFLNGASIIKFQLLCASIFGAVCLTAKILSIRHYGIVGIPWAVILTYGLAVVLPYSFFVPRFFQSWLRHARKPDPIAVAPKI
ncbi:lipopolysaccharide biosynthesis protein [Edaphobacter modestus]|uniref:O-antigen/teichoic acid export membrane protein n=1 Tax=Edaphobacter modestus TaxID=388466 RepID=A0A4Q7YWA1_9BACT|nr:oligosaccharide flippase family protein [Edaphobacter modestus]RZU41355.1 O-antigen/teichoic acid export membrane protein [Edaphobacter modestus]